MEIKIIEPNGWSKSMRIDKALIRIGSGPGVEIQIPSIQIAPLHLQLLNSPDLPSGCRALNLNAAVEVQRGKMSIPLATYAKLDLRDGDEILVGEYRLSLSLPAAAALVRSSRSIQASLAFPDSTLRPEAALVGTLLVRNSGSQPACQFEVTLSGLPDDCYQIDPIPLMYPGAQEEVHLRLYHRRLYPPAGAQELIFTITAPDDYPGEELVISQSVYIMPVFAQELLIADDLSSPPAVRTEPVSQSVPPPALEFPPQLPIETSPAVETSALQEPEPVALEVAAEPQIAAPELPAQTPAVVAPRRPASRRSRALDAAAEAAKPAAPVEPAAPPAPPENRSRPKVVRSQPDDFWDEG